MTSYSGVSRTRVARINTCPTPTISVLSQTNTTCNGLSDGAASVTATGGTSFTYTWLPAGGNGSSASGLVAGNYTCSTTNQCGLFSSQTIVITEPSIVTVTAREVIVCV
ncbi:MAG: SprB repeat-containing protein [Bacteroidetes bacterium]|nr:SprB repeat-containing protein [Bacteroidota bacterium]